MDKLREELSKMKFDTTTLIDFGTHLTMHDIDQIISLFQAYLKDYVKLSKDFPKIICLCGSTRFVDYYNHWRKEFTLQGYIVLGIELVVPQTHQQDPQHNDYATKKMLDELHMRKTDLADEVFVLNVGGYIGESTRNEINYAESIGKTVKYLEQASAKLRERAILRIPRLQSWGVSNARVSTTDKIRIRKGESNGIFNTEPRTQARD